MQLAATYIAFAIPDQKFLAFLHLGDIKKFYIVH